MWCRKDAQQWIKSFEFSASHWANTHNAGARWINGCYDPRPKHGDGFYRRHNSAPANTFIIKWWGRRHGRREYSKWFAQ